MNAVHRSMMAIATGALLLVGAGVASAVPTPCGPTVNGILCGPIEHPMDFLDWTFLAEAGGPVISVQHATFLNTNVVTLTDTTNSFQRFDQKGTPSEPEHVFDQWGGNFALGVAVLSTGSFDIKPQHIVQIDFDNSVAGAGFHIQKDPGGSTGLTTDPFLSVIRAFHEETPNNFVELTPPGGFSLKSDDPGSCRAPLFDFAGQPQGCPYGSAIFLGVGNPSGSGSPAVIDRITVQVFNDDDPSGPDVNFAFDRLLIGEIPEPASLVLLGVGLIGFTVARRRRG